MAIAFQRKNYHRLWPLHYRESITLGSLNSTIPPGVLREIERETTPPYTAWRILCNQPKSPSSELPIPELICNLIRSSLSALICETIIRLGQATLSPQRTTPSLYNSIKRPSRYIAEIRIRLLPQRIFRKCEQVRGINRVLPYFTFFINILVRVYINKKYLHYCVHSEAEKERCALF